MGAAHVVIRNSEIAGGAHRFARALDAAGVAARDTIAVLLPNVREYLFAYRGASWSGRLFTPLSWRWTPDEAAYVVGDCGARALVAHARFPEAALAAGASLPEAARFVVGGALEGFRPWSDVQRFSDAELETPLAGGTLAYTSGTTGHPKGVVRPTEQLEGPPPTRIARVGMQMFRMFNEGAQERAHLVACPLYHSAPNAYCDGAAMLGADIVLMDGWEPEICLQLIERYGVTSTFMVPIQFVRLLKLPASVRRKYDLSSLRLILHGGAPVAPAIKQAMIDWLGPILFEFYGGTEGGGTAISSQEWLEHPGSVGRPRPGVGVHILDDAGQPCPAGVEGGVYFADEPFVYKDDPEKTAAARRGDLFTLGDIGYLDAAGYLYLCDRRVPHPAVADCCVVGVPDEQWGESVRAVVQLVAGQAASDVEPALRAWCGERLADYERPRSFDFVEALPRTETGKLARRKVRDTYWQGRARRI
jgi:long-chain acyl-CoA synthetase